ncbi:hypothetical protein AX774_g5612 [Zancudomyces culisetae]|uniref:Uncharacterized protein n=1 Tax=Zancudomyces culisetae TaxID=1213189 RepID=A0A1R1PJ04_ZANCU|nr:hypothetical protein AX774_g5612 [Zancudomyces culisetae]|eukprot:OMH80937.1 hypothetical protein AX774_g5612 [Zancudomyces culisetae]
MGRADRNTRLVRTKKGQKFYDESCLELKKKHGSVSSYVRHVLIKELYDNNCENPASSTDKNCDEDCSDNQPPAVSIKMDRSTLLLKKNDFPYAVETDIEHYLLWSFNALKVGTTPEPYVKEYIEECFPSKDNEYLWFVNPPHLQSIPDLHHGHLMIRKKKE